MAKHPKYIIILLSDQTIPNVMFIKWYLRNSLERLNLVYITTQSMEEKNIAEHINSVISQWTLFLQQIDKIEVDENNITNISQTLSSYFDHLEANLVVNITGGTKIMSLAVYEYFKEKRNTEIYYQPINKPLLRILPNTETFSINELLTLNEYLKAYGITYDKQNTCLMDFEYNKTVYDRIIKQHSHARHQLFKIQDHSWITSKFNKGQTINLEEPDDNKFTQIFPAVNRKQIIDYINLFGFNHKELKKRELKYMTGGWFEEYVFQKLQKEKKIPSDNIALNVSIHTKKIPNEFDIMYLDNRNRLHIIECKSAFGKTENDNGNKLIISTIYKAQALKSKFGLTVQSAIYTKSAIPDFALQRAKDFHIEIKAGDEI